MNTHLEPVNGSTTSPFDDIKHINPETGAEIWSARDLMPLMGYPRWNEFKIPLERAMKSAEVQGAGVENNFRGSTEVKKPGSRGPAGEDFLLTRFAAYLVAMNGDPNKPEVAAAQAYFAIKTREAETTPRKLTGRELMAKALIEADSTIKELEADRAKMVAELEEAKPKIEYHDEFIAERDLIQFRTLANQLNVGEQTMRRELQKHGWIYDMPVERWSNTEARKVVEHRWRCKADKKRYFQLVPYHDAPRLLGEVRQSLKITPAGAAAVTRALRRWGVLDETSIEVLA